MHFLRIQNWVMLCEVFGHSLHEVWSRHEDANGTDDGEDREGHEAQAVHHAGCELPLTTDGFTLVLAAEAVGNVADLLQDLGQVWVPLCGLSTMQEVLIMRRGTGHAATHNPRVRGRGAVHALQASEADVQKVPIAGRGPCTCTQLHTGQAAASLLVLASRADLVFPRPLHAQEPCTPVKKNDSGLGGQQNVKRGQEVDTDCDSNVILHNRPDFVDPGANRFHHLPNDSTLASSAKAL